MHRKRDCRRQPMAWSGPWASNAKVDRPRIRRLAARQVRSPSGHAVPPRVELHEERITNGAT